MRAADYEFAMDHDKLTELLEILTEFRDALSLRALPLAHRRHPRASLDPEQQLKRSMSEPKA